MLNDAMRLALLDNAGPGACANAVRVDKAYAALVRAAGGAMDASWPTSDAQPFEAEKNFPALTQNMRLALLDNLGPRTYANAVCIDDAYEALVAAAGGSIVVSCAVSN